MLFSTQRLVIFNKQLSSTVQTSTNALRSNLLLRIRASAPALAELLRGVLCGNLITSQGGKGTKSLLESVFLEPPMAVPLFILRLHHSSKNSFLFSASLLICGFAAPVCYTIFPTELFCLTPTWKDFRVPL